MHLRAWVDCLFVCDVSVMGPSCSPGSSRLCDRLHPGAPGERPTGQQRCIDRGISGQATRGTAPVDRVGQKPAVPHPGGNVCGACACRVHVSISPPIQCLHAWCCAVLAHSASTGVVEFCTRAAQASRAKELPASWNIHTFTNALPDSVLAHDQLPTRQRATHIVDGVSCTWLVFVIPLPRHLFIRCARQQRHVPGLGGGPPLCNDAA